MISRLSGVPAATIRMWERRYRALMPLRSPAGGRLYSRADVGRLGLLRQLVEGGHAIGTIAGLSESKLQQLAGEGVHRVAAGVQCRIAAAGGVLAARLQPEACADPRVRWVGTYDSIGQLIAGSRTERPDAVMVELPSLGPAQVAQVLELLQEVAPRLVVVVYAYAAERDLKPLRSDRVLLMRGRVDSALLLRLCLMSLNMPPGDARQPFDALLAQSVPEALYSEQELAELAAASSTIRCECPSHLSELLLSLRAFESYSKGCQDLNQQDAAVHAMLRSVSGHARALLEEGLRRVIALESELPARPS